MNNIYFLRFFLQFVLVFSLYFIKIGPFSPKNASKKNCLFYPPSLLGNQALACCHGFKSFFSGIFFRILGHFQCLNLPYDSIRTIREQWFNVLMYVNHIGQDNNNIPQQNARKS
jgi:hypothetical protein